MTDSEFLADLRTAVASRAEVQMCTTREAFVAEILERLREAGEVPEGEPCPESLTGQNGRKLEIDAWCDDEADGALHLFVAIMDIGDAPSVLTLKEAREVGFNRLLGIYDQARSGWLGDNIEESRPLWELAQRIRNQGLPTALRLSVISDKSHDRIRGIPGDQTKDGVPVSFKVWGLAGLKALHESQTVRDDLTVVFTGMPEGGLPVLPASVGTEDYEAFLAAMPGETLADIFIEHGSRLLEGNVRTFLGRGSGVNKGIAKTVNEKPKNFFAYNNGITATATSVTTSKDPQGRLLVTSAVDLQIVNGAQTTASLAACRRDKSLRAGSVFVPMKLSVVSPEVGSDLIPAISRYANSQNGVRPSDFFANHPFHRRIEEASRRILAPAVGGSSVQSHWYYERARGQYLNDQVGMTASQRSRFALVNPRKQLITKTDLAKVVTCFGLEADTACKGAEKAFTSFAERVSKDWENEAVRAAYNDEWFRSLVTQVILYRAAEGITSKASWYQGGYRSQIVAYTCMRLSALAKELGSGLKFSRIWNQQAAGAVIEAQIELIGRRMLDHLLETPRVGQNVSEWAKQQACRKTALEARVDIHPQFEDWVETGARMIAGARAARREQRVQDEVDALKRVLQFDKTYWTALAEFCRKNQIGGLEEDKALTTALKIPRILPTEKQASCLLSLIELASVAGWEFSMEMEA